MNRQHFIFLGLVAVLFGALCLAQEVSITPGGSGTLTESQFNTNQFGVDGGVVSFKTLGFQTNPVVQGVALFTNNSSGSYWQAGDSGDFEDGLRFGIKTVGSDPAEFSLWPGGLLQLSGGLSVTGGQTNGSILVATNSVQISFPGTLSDDDTWRGEVLTELATGEDVNQWEAVYLNGSGDFMLADANGAGKFPALGLAVADSNSDAVVVLIKGTVRNDAWNWTPGGAIYLSATIGELTQTAPSTTGDCVQLVGRAVAADIAYFNFTGHYLEVE